MSKKTVILSLITLVFMFYSQSLYAGEFTHTLEDSKINFSWTLEEDLIHIKISAKTTGWVAIGFNPDKVMQNSNIVMGYVKKGVVKITDHFGTSERTHKADTKLGGISNITDKQGSETDGITELSFIIPLDSGDSYDKPVNSGKNIVMLAHGAGRDSFKSMHEYKVLYEIDLTTGEAKKLK